MEISELLEYLPALLTAVISGVVGLLFKALKEALVKKVDALVKAKDEKLEELKNYNVSLANLCSSKENEVYSLKESLDELAKIVKLQNEIIENKTQQLESLVNNFNKNAEVIANQNVDIEALLRKE